MDRDEAILYCVGFISWMKSGLKDNKEFNKQVLQLEQAFNTVVKSYNDEIAELKNEAKM